jgi:hypothetical protein
MDAADGCSIPGIFAWIVNPNNMFQGCCRDHDLCYAQCHDSKMFCDIALYNCMLNICAGDGGCKFNAQRIVSAVDLVGQSSYDHAHETHCLCEEDTGPFGHVQSWDEER